MKINVTEEHISRGQRRHRCRCPIALALLDAGYTRPKVTTYSVSFRSKKKRIILKFILPLKAQRFVDMFDGLGQRRSTRERTKVQPFSFHLRKKDD